MRKAFFTLVLALIIVPVVLLTSCKQDNTSPVGATHPYAGAWNLVVDTSTVQKGQMNVGTDGNFYIDLPLQYDSLTRHDSLRKITGTISTGGQLSGVILNKSTGAQIGTISGSLSGTIGNGSYINTLIPYSRLWVVTKL